MSEMPAPGCYVDSHWGQYAVARAIHMTTRQRKVWTYKGVNVYPSAPNATGIRWHSAPVEGIGTLLADTKEGMRQLITHYTEPSYERTGDAS